MAKSSGLRSVCFDDWTFSSVLDGQLFKVVLHQKNLDGVHPMSLKIYLFLFLSLIVAGVFSFLPGKEEVPPQMLLIPAGPFIMGSNDLPGEIETGGELGNKKPFYLDEHPQRTLFIDDFYIDRFEVTNEDYQRFVQEKKRRPPPYWKGESYPEGQALLPVIEVNWYEARDYCQWLDKRLPTESEWEKAARGPNGNLYVWGNEFDGKKANVSAGAHGGIMMVGRFIEDRSVYDVYDLNGNIMEWTADWYQPYPGSDYDSDDFGQQFKVAKGDAYGESGHYALSIFSRLSYRQNVKAEMRLPFLGIRCAKDREKRRFLGRF